MGNDSQYNSLYAFKSILENPYATVNPARISSNRINNVGDALEVYIKDAYCGVLGSQLSQDEKELTVYPAAFSWLGNSGNPPDCLLRNGDGIEVKKIQSMNADIALNSSFPKSKLHVDDSRVATGAKASEEWIERDIVYAIGTVIDDELRRLWLIYGDCYAASRDTYEKLFTVISDGVKTIPDVEFCETNELAKVKKVDPLGITEMRVRGMWHIQNPSRLYAHLTTVTPHRQYYVLMREDKYQSFPEYQRNELEELNLDGYENSIIEIRDPDNPAHVIKARFIKYEI
ncbi:MAG TPA: NgoPII family restriction endonuclease [Candidatus Saccharimonadales bacterium]|nr:NgoPII family restriction endonuclease [Candidatus Saccharimonadales bacterium]